MQGENPAWQGKRNVCPENKTVLREKLSHICWTGLGMSGQGGLDWDQGQSLDGGRGRTAQGGAGGAGGQGGHACSYIILA